MLSPLNSSDEVSVYNPDNGVYSVAAFTLPQNWETNGSSIKFNNIEYKKSDYNTNDDLLNAIINETGGKYKIEVNTDLDFKFLSPDKVSARSLCGKADKVLIIKDSASKVMEYYAYFDTLDFNVSGTFERDNSQKNVFSSTDSGRTDCIGYVDKVDEDQWMKLNNVFIKLDISKEASCTRFNGSAFKVINGISSNAERWCSDNRTPDIETYKKSDSSKIWIFSNSDSSKKNAVGNLFALDSSKLDSNNSITVGNQTFVYNPLAKDYDQLKYKSKEDLINKVKSYYSNLKESTNGIEFRFNKDTNQASFINKKDLKTKIGNAENKNTSIGENSSNYNNYDEFIAKLEEAKEVYNSTDNSQEDVNSMVADLQKAYDACKEKSAKQLAFEAVCKKIKYSINDDEDSVKAKLPQEGFNYEIVKDSFSNDGKGKINYIIKLQEENGTTTHINIIGTYEIKKVESIAISGPESINKKGGNIQLKAKVSPDDAAVKSVIWRITKGNGENIAKIDETGKVTATKKGNGTITVRAIADDESGVLSNEIEILITGQDAAVIVESDIEDLFNDFEFSVFTTESEVESIVKKTFADAEISVNNFENDRVEGTVNFKVTVESVSVKISGEYGVIEEGSEAKQNLIDTIDSASTTMAAVSVSKYEDGRDIDSNKEWVLESVYKQLKKILEEAKKIYLDKDADDIQCEDIRFKLEKEIKYFNSSKKYGTKREIRKIQIDGTRRVLQTLTARVYDENNNKMTTGLSYEWYKVKNQNDSVEYGQKIGKGSTYKLEGSDRGYYIAVKVSSDGGSELISDLVGPIAKVVSSNVSSGDSGGSGGGSSSGSSAESDLSNSINSIINSNNDKNNMENTNIDNDDNTKMGWQKYNTSWYYIDKNGLKAKGWQKINNNWYYLNQDGIMQTGWKNINNHWYYLNQDGIMQIGWKNINNHWYYMEQSGSMKTGWLKDFNNNWYYLNNNGEMITGWLKDSNNNWYYLKANGVMASNEYVDGYYLGSDGAWQN